MKPVPVIESMYVSEEEQLQIKQKEEHIANYIKALATVEEEMEPFKEHKRDLKTNYIENGWLSREEISMAVKAYRLLSDDVDVDQLMDFYKQVSKSIGR